MPAAWGAVVLAAGASLRMGRAKQLLELNGVPLVARAAQAALDAEYWPVIVVLGAHAADIRPAIARIPVLPVENSAWPEGMASSLRAGMGALTQFSRSMSGVLLVLCDQPGFTPEVARRLRVVQAETGKSMVAAAYAGRLGVPALFTRDHFPALSALTGEEGARALLQRTPADVAAVDLPDLALDVDTPADWAKVEAASRPPGVNRVLRLGEAGGTAG